MKPYFTDDDRVFRPHSSIRYNGPMATEAKKREPLWYRACHGVASVLMLALAMLAAILLINLAGPT